MLDINQLNGFNVGNTPPVLTYINSYWTSTGNNTSYTFTSSSIGEARSDRLVVVCCHNNGTAGTITSATIGGVSMNLVANVTSSGRTTAIFSLIVPTGTTATVVFSLTSGAGSVGGGISIFNITGLSSTAAYNTNTATGSTSSITDTVNVLDSGVVIAIAMHDNDASGTWTNLTSNFTVDVGGNHTYTSGSASKLAATTAYSVTATFSTSAQESLCVASWR